jgi:serine/threonine kinase PknH
MYPYTPGDNRHPGAGQQWQPTYPPAPSTHWDAPRSSGYAHVVREWRKPSVNPYGVSCPQPPAAPPARTRRATRWVGITAGVVVLAAVASAIVWWPHSIGEGGTEAPAAAAPPPAAPVSVSAMDALLLSRAEAGTIFGTGPMGPREGRSDEVYTRMSPHTPVVDDDCNQGTPAQARSHEGSGWRAVRQQFLSTPDTGNAEDSRSLKQAVVNFSDAATAQRFVDTSKAAWQRCANRSLNLTTVANTGAPSDYWNSGEVSETGGGIRMTFTQEGQDGWSCDDSMTPHNNVVVELELCGLNPTKPVDEVLAQITDNIEAAAK